MKICIQPGHINIPFNCIPALRTSTGAPGEQEFTLRIVNRLSEILRSKGFEVKQTDANANCDPKVTGVDWDLYLAVHYDANVYGTGGGFVDFPEPSTDGATQESQRIAQAIREEYFNHSGIVNHPERSNSNTRFYYMWRALSAKTPCVILECGVGKDAHDSVILADTERVSNAIARGVTKAFGIAFDAPIPPTDPCITVRKELEEANKKIKELQNQLTFEVTNRKTIANQSIELLKKLTI